ncbi:Hypothetical predicted protein [Mytilus galloprovincialis]|uniref:Uncharacterized protein n=1 Tax=Mytilus galloprovincialis TaxID=29158 RepID=A0A8B6BYR2_MYTGA|nr:Hypothetical predicted protein [Mytilus galloprovincialis]
MGTIRKLTERKKTRIISRKTALKRLFHGNFHAGVHIMMLLSARGSAKEMTINSNQGHAFRVEINHPHGISVVQMTYTHGSHSKTEYMVFNFLPLRDVRDRNEKNKASSFSKMFPSPGRRSRKSSPKSVDDMTLAQEKDERAIQTPSQEMEKRAIQFPSTSLEVVIRSFFSFNIIESSRTPPSPQLKEIIKSSPSPPPLDIEEVIKSFSSLNIGKQTTTPKVEKVTRMRMSPKITELVKLSPSQEVDIEATETSLPVAVHIASQNIGGNNFSI